MTAPAGRHVPQEPPQNLEAARAYMRRSCMPIPVEFRGKRPIGKRWSAQRLKEDELDRHFGRNRRDVGILLGEPSGWLVDVDLDCPEALVLADALLRARLQAAASATPTEVA